jgi:hypothetical protein
MSTTPVAAVRDPFISTSSPSGGLFYHHGLRDVFHGETHGKRLDIGAGSDSVDGMNIRLGLLTMLLAAASLQGQTAGVIVGRVTDASGAIVQSAKIEITNQATGIKENTTASAQGEYVFPRVTPGNYQMTVSAPGFKTLVRNDIPLLVNQTAREDVSLTVGDVASSVQVEAEAPVVQSETSSIGQVVDGPQVSQMPLNGRDSIYGLLAMVPGVQDSGSNPMISGSAYRGGTSITIDGANGDDALNERINLPVPSLDTVSEFKVLTNGSPAEFGKPAQVIVATKGGANQIHGSLLEFNRNNVMAAKSHAAELIAKPPYKRNEFGGSIGGPIKKNKLFYFGSYEGLRLVQYTLTQESMPTAAMKTGNFAGIYAIKDPLAGGALFPGAIIPSSRISPIAQDFLPFLPNPNQPGSSNGLGVNLAENVPTDQPNDRYSTRADYQISAKDTLNVRYFWVNNGPYVNATGGGILFDNWGGYGLTSKNLASSYTRVLTASLVNVFNFNINYWHDYRKPQNATFNVNTVIPQDPAPQTGLGGLPTITMSGFTTMQDQPGSDDVNHNQTLTDSLNWQKGKHTFKFGLSLTRVSVVNRQNSSPYRGSFTFNGTYSGEAFADFLLGDITSSSYITSNFTLDDVNYRTAYYAQDDWRVNSHLTMNVGLRYEYETPWEKRNDLSYWSQSLNELVVVQGNAVPALANALPMVTGKSLGVNTDNYINLGKKNFAPRVGLAYRPFDTSKFVIRASYGIFYNPMSEYDDQIDARDLGLNPPFRATYVFNAPAGTPTITWANPFPGSGTVTPSSSVYGITPDFHAGYEQNWNFTTEWEALHNTVLRTSYLGSKGTHLPITIDVNEPVLGPGTIQNLRQYQPFGDIYLYQSTRNDFLNQAQIGVTHRTGHGLEFGFEYSFTKDLTPSYNGVLPYDSYNLRLDRGNDPMYSRNYLVANYIYNLPIGRGQAVFGNVSNKLNRLVGGWQIAGIITAASGHYACLTTNSKETGYQYPTCTPRANIVGNPNVSNQTQYEWFNPAAYAVPSSQYIYGNSAPYSMQTPGNFNWDAALYKFTTITERIRLQIRMEAFDCLNHANLSSLQTNVSNSQLGVSTSRTDSRVVEFGGRLSF